MIHVIPGTKGSGKTKRLIDLANEAVKTEHGVVVFIDDDNRYMYDLRHEIRFVNAGEFALGEHRSTDWFYGLLAGMLSVNYDISLVYVDAFAKLVNKQKWDDMQDFFIRLENLSLKNNVELILSVNGDVETLPPFITKYAIL